jgi:hypothetical protein
MKIIRAAKAAVRREQDSRRVAKSVQDHQSFLNALGSATSKTDEKVKGK